MYINIIVKLYAFNMGIKFDDGYVYNWSMNNYCVVNYNMVVYYNY